MLRLFAIPIVLTLVAVGVLAGLTVSLLHLDLPPRPRQVGVTLAPGAPATG